MSRFEEFWKIWPSNIQGGYQRKGGKSVCLAKWNKFSYDSQFEIIKRHIYWLKTTPDWLKDRGAFIPMPITYLNQQRWDGCEIPEAPQNAIDPALMAIKRHEATWTPPSAETRLKMAQILSKKSLHN